MQRDARSDILFSFTDIMPTFLASAGITSQPVMSGVNLTPWLLGARSDDPRSWIAWRFGPNVAIKTRDWKLYLAALPGPEEADFTTPGDEGGAPSPEKLRQMHANEAERMARAPLYGVAEPEFGWHAMLYDLNRDAGEQVNVAAEYPDQVKELRRILDEWAGDLPVELLWGPQTIRVYETPDKIRVRMPG